MPVTNRWPVNRPHHQRKDVSLSIFRYWPCLSVPCRTRWLWRMSANRSSNSGRTTATNQKPKETVTMVFSSLIFNFLVFLQSSLPFPRSAVSCWKLTRLWHTTVVQCGHCHWTPRRNCRSDIRWLKSRLKTRGKLSFFSCLFNLNKKKKTACHGSHTHTHRIVKLFISGFWCCVRDSFISRSDFLEEKSQTVPETAESFLFVVWKNVYTRKCWVFFFFFQIVPLLLLEGDCFSLRIITQACALCKVFVAKARTRADAASTISINK